MRKHVYLTGMMGSGKTTIGRMLAQRLGCPFVDADERIEQAAGVKIARIFELEGEAGFRERETRALREIAAGKPCVVATGGGAVLRDENVALMRRTGVVVLLDRSLSDMVRDVSQEERPNLAGDKAERMQALYEARKDRYRETCDIAFDNGGSPLGAARRLAELLRAQDMKRRGGNRMLKDLVIKNRSYRRFDESVRVTEETLRGIGRERAGAEVPARHISGGLRAGICNAGLGGGAAGLAGSESGRAARLLHRCTERPERRKEQADGRGHRRADDAPGRDGERAWRVHAR